MGSILKIQLLAFSLCAMLLPACGGGGGGGSNTPSGPNNPSSTMVTVVNAQGIALVDIMVTLSTGIQTDAQGVQAASGVVSTQVTNVLGIATLSPPATGAFCVSAAQGSINVGSYAFTGGCNSQPIPAAITLTFK